MFGIITQIQTILNLGTIPNFWNHWGIFGTIPRFRNFLTHSGPYKHTLLRRGSYWYLNKTLRVINACGTTGREKGAVSLILSRRLMLSPVRFPFPSFRPPRDIKRPPRGRKEGEITSKCSEKAIFRVSLFLQSKRLKATTQNPKI